MTITKWIIASIFAIQTVFAQTTTLPQESGINPSNEQLVAITGLLAEPMVPLPTTPKLPLSFLADEIRQYEGWYPGSRAYKNNNPGNLRYASQTGSIGKDDANFAIFQTYEDGYGALLDLLGQAVNGTSRLYKPSMTLSDFFHVYAPPFENDSEAYGSVVARRMGVPAAATLKQIFGS